MKTLVVQYLPRGERSKTKAVLDAFLKEANGKTEIETLDLITNTPDMFLQDNVMAYYERDYAGQTLSPEKAKLLAKMDAMTAQVLAADRVVLAYPMYNFSFPAVVKAWFDSIMLKGKTWDVGASGYIGLMGGKKALIISSSGGVYNEQFGTAKMEHSLSLGQTEFTFMGFSEVHTVSAEGINMMPEKAEEILSTAVSKIQTLSKTFF